MGVAEVFMKTQNERCYAKGCCRFGSSSTFEWATPQNKCYIIYKEVEAGLPAIETFTIVASAWQENGFLKAALQLCATSYCDHTTPV